jgi:hypothetical protein
MKTIDEKVTPSYENLKQLSCDSHLVGPSLPSINIKGYACDIDFDLCRGEERRLSLDLELFHHFVVSGGSGG